MKKSGINTIPDSLNDQIKYDYDLSKQSWFGIGGTSSIFFQPKDKSHLKNFLTNIKLKKFFPIGSGSNILFREKVFQGTIIKLGKGFSKIEEIDGKIFAEAGAQKFSVAEFAKKNSFSQFEFMAAIPGTIGGGVFMNAGCFGSEFFDLIEEINAIDLKGNDICLKKKDINFSYRNSNIDNNIIILNVLFKKTKKVKIQSIIKKISLLKLKKKKNQPQAIKTGGSTFKNPTYKTKMKAWELIKKYNCHNLRFGKAKFSSVHCNFIDNSEKATSKDIEKLIKTTQKEIYNKSGIDLELEIKII